MVTTAAPIVQVGKWIPRRGSRLTQLVGGQARILVLDSLTLGPIRV